MGSRYLALVSDASQLHNNRRKHSVKKAGTGLVGSDQGLLCEAVRDSQYQWNRKEKGVERIPRNFPSASIQDTYLSVFVRSP